MASAKCACLDIWFKEKGKGPAGMVLPGLYVGAHYQAGGSEHWMKAHSIQWRVRIRDEKSPRIVEMKNVTDLNVSLKDKTGANLLECLPHIWRFLDSAYGPRCYSGSKPPVILQSSVVSSDVTASPTPPTRKRLLSFIMSCSDHMDDDAVMNPVPTLIPKKRRLFTSAASSSLSPCSASSCIPICLDPLLNTAGFFPTHHHHAASQPPDNVTPWRLTTRCHDNQPREMKEMTKRHAHILVHCTAGISRSVAVVCSWLMRRYGWSDRYALAFVRIARPVAMPNDGFLQQLRELHWQLRVWEKLTRPHQRRQKAYQMLHDGTNMKPRDIATVLNYLSPLCLG